MANLTYISIEPISTNPDAITVADAKDHCNCDVDTWDNLFPVWIAAARMDLERYTSRVFLKSNVTAVYEKRKECSERVYLAFSDNIVLEDGSQYTVSNGTVEASGRVIELKYTAGYETMPDWIKQAVKMYVADLYESRGDGKDGNVGKDARSFCAPFINHVVM